eukprot:gb/GEZN01008038.1/.p1 GENE.gb/GEZN01008038.1/~~gb/GEZN01008038.1/.p1  ORF type:complete len:443 (-),score=58.51 gb/GEZN01008038.1/:92-1420(-)
MAALLCKAVCVKPCELCGTCCGKCCSAFNEACDECGKACNECNKACGIYCNCIYEFFDLPFSSFLSFAYALNLGAAIYGALGLKQISNCTTPNFKLLLFVCLGLFVVNFFFGVYLHGKIMQWFRLHAPPPVDSEEGGSRGPRLRTAGERNIVKRRVLSEAVKFLQYDVLFAIYILISFASLGFSFYLATLSSKCSEPSGVAAGKARSVVVTCGSLLMLYEIVGFCLIIGRLMMQCCQDCMDDCNPLTLVFCCIYYPFMYDGAKAGRQRRERQAQEEAEFDQRRGQQGRSGYSGLSSNSSQPVSASRPPQQQTMSNQQVPAQNPQYVQQQQQYAQYAQTQPQIQMHSPPGVATAQPIQPVFNSPPAYPTGQPGSGEAGSETTGVKVAKGMAKGGLMVGKMALGAGLAAVQAGAKYVSEENKKKPVTNHGSGRAGEAGGYGGTY